MYIFKSKGQWRKLPPEKYDRIYTDNIYDNNSGRCSDDLLYYVSMCYDPQEKAKGQEKCL